MKFRVRILVENDAGDEVLLTESIEYEREGSSVENLGLELVGVKRVIAKNSTGDGHRASPEIYKAIGILSSLPQKTIKQRKTSHCLSNTFRQNRIGKSTAILLRL